VTSTPLLFAISSIAGSRGEWVLGTHPHRGGSVAKPNRQPSQADQVGLHERSHRSLAKKFTARIGLPAQFQQAKRKLPGQSTKTE
jgi:hypothetical protein